jgi:hypothetical protein
MDAGFHGNLEFSVAAESITALKRNRHALDPYAAGESLEINARNRAAHHMRTHACGQGPSIAHICPQ